MRIIVFIFLTSIMSHFSYAQTIDNNSELTDDEFFELMMDEGITIFGDRSLTETRILTALNGSISERRNFIENDLLENSGFRRTGNIRFRRTSASEKGLSVLHGFGSLLSFGLIPMTPFFEVDYGRLPSGYYYSFESVFISSEFTDVSLEVFSIMKLEYMLHIEFGNGIVMSPTINYYTEEKISYFEYLINSLPDYPENIARIKERFLNTELPRIRRAFERHSNLSDDNLRAIENLGNG